MLHRGWTSGIAPQGPLNAPGLRNGINSTSGDRIARETISNRRASYPRKIAVAHLAIAACSSIVLKGESTLVDPQPLRLIGRRLSDDDLLRTEFCYRDPENLPSLNRGVPDQDAHPVIVGYYDERPAGGRKANPGAPMIRCCHCGYPRHWKGYVVRDDKGETYIIGADKCGREHYGARFEAAERSFKQEQARQKALTRWRNMTGLVPPMNAEVERILTCEAVRMIERKRDEIRRASPEGFDRLIRHHGSGDPMVEVIVECDYAAEADRKARYERAMAAYAALPPEERRGRRDQGLKPELDNSPILIRETEPLGPLMGAGFLTDRGDVRAAALALRDTLRAIEKLNAAGTDAANLNDLNRLLREMTDRPKAVWNAFLELSFTSIFFEDDNLERLERWSRAFPRFSYFADDGALLVNDSSKGRTRISAIADADLPETRTIDSLNYYTEEFLPMIADAA
ncbi:MAG TPA: hypothetical protein VEZ20_03240 [Allosphingosinicella sp.]|jgi:hypothetical protein|nr:hypothetical protein [Allosphingosinicella sp.]